MHICILFQVPTAKLQQLNHIQCTYILQETAVINHRCAHVRSEGYCSCLVCVCVCVCMYVCMYVCMRLCMYVRMYASLFVAFCHHTHLDPEIYSRYVRVQNDMKKPFYNHDFC